jgi:hypothetical protein
VLAYQGWTFWVFRKRLSPADLSRPDPAAAAEPSPADHAPAAP